MTRIDDNDPGRASRATQLIVSGADLTDEGARAQRDQLADRTDVIDKVGVLRTLPDGFNATTDMVATFYEVDRETILTVVKRNRDEIESDGFRVVPRGEVTSVLNVTPDEIGMSKTAPAVSLFPRRAVLRFGMLLRDSLVARSVRDLLLDAERSKFVIPQTYAEALRAVADEHEGRMLAESRVAVLEPKAELADNYLTAQGGARLVRQVAKTFGMKEHELRQFMIDEGLIFVRHSPCGEVQYDHYAQFSHYFLPREKIVEHRWGSCTHYTLMLLPRGVELLSKRLKAQGR